MKNVANGGLDQGRVQGDGERGHLTRQVIGAIAGAGLTGLDHGPGDLGDQVRLPVGGRAEGAQRVLLIVPKSLIGQWQSARRRAMRRQRHWCGVPRESCGFRSGERI